MRINTIEALIDLFRRVRFLERWADNMAGKFDSIDAAIVAVSDLLGEMRTEISSLQSAIKAVPTVSDDDTAEIEERAKKLMTLVASAHAAVSDVVPAAPPAATPAGEDTVPAASSDTAPSGSSDPFSHTPVVTEPEPTEENTRPDHSA